jgi:hypothetical protein
MSARPTLAHRATDRLADAVMPPPLARAEDEARAIAAIEQALAERERLLRSKRILKVAASLAVAAILLIAAGSAWRRASSTTAPLAESTPRAPVAMTPATAEPSAVPVVTPPPAVRMTAHAIAGTVVVLHDGHALPLEGAGDLDVADRLLASSDGRVSVALSTGSHLVAEPGTELSILESTATQAFELRAGAVQADVAKLGPSDRFIIRTSDAEIEVRGTSFHVTITKPLATCGSGTVTRVAVSEGVVVVRSRGLEDRVKAGEAWPRGCQTPKAVASPSTTAEAITVSDLAEQNRMFAAATAARRQGDATRAIGLYEEFTLRHPSSALAESAAVERMRLLAGVDPPRARQAASDYLARHPRGFARREAETIAAGHP